MYQDYLETLEAGIWRHSKTQGLYLLLGVGSILTPFDDIALLSCIGPGTYSEAPLRPLAVYLDMSRIRPNGQWVVEPLGSDISSTKPGQKFVVYSRLGTDDEANGRLWVRPLEGPAGWIMPVTIGGLSRPRFTFFRTSL